MFQDLDPKLASALAQLRQEFEDKLQQQRNELKQIISGAPAEVEESREPMVTAVSEIDTAFPVLDALEELKHAATDIDRSETQAELLDSLIRGTNRFAERVAVFLSREDGLHGWGSAGFGDRARLLAEMKLAPAPDSPWQQVLSGNGGVPLSAAECAPICERLGVSEPSVGLLVPFVLGDRVAAVLYCDRVHSDSPFNTSAVQLLSFIAGQTLETLPVRKRATTSSLHLADTTAPETPAETPEVAQGVPIAEPMETVAPEIAPLQEEATTPPPEPSSEPEPEVVEVLEEAAESLAPPADELTVPGGAEEPVQIAEPTPEPEPQPPWTAEPTPEPAPPTEETPPPPAAEPTPPPSAVQPPSPEPAVGASSTQVAPPQDIDGPGWAFTTTRIPAGGGNDAQHEEARRLARLLVTEIKLYNEEEVEEGRQAGNVYARLREDIDRSQQIYNDRIAPEVREEKDYFHEALVRILAGGEAQVLGI